MVNDLQSNALAQTYVPNEIQNSLWKMSGNPDLKQLGLPKIPSDFSFAFFYYSLKPRDHDECKGFDSNIKKSNEDQAYVFNSTLN